MQLTPPSSKVLIVSGTPNSTSSNKSHESITQTQDQLKRVMSSELYNATFKSNSLLEEHCQADQKVVNAVLSHLKLGKFYNSSTKYFKQWPSHWWAWMLILTCIQFWFHQCQTSFTFAITHSLITANPTMLNLSSIIHHLSSMATPNIELTQFPMSQFSQYSVDSPPHFAHLLIQSNDPVLQMTCAIGDKVQFKTYPTPCIFLGMKRTALVDNEVWREHHKAEFGLPGISPSSTQPVVIKYMCIYFHISYKREKN